MNSRFGQTSGLTDILWKGARNFQAILLDPYLAVIIHLYATPRASVAVN